MFSFSIRGLEHFALFIEDENEYTPVDAVVNDDLKERVREILKTAIDRCLKNDVAPQAALEQAQLEIDKLTK